MDELDLSIAETEFFSSIDEIEDLLSASGDILDKQLKGLSFVLLFACYERLINDICKELIRVADTYTGEASSLSPGFRVVYLSDRLKSFKDCGKRNRWSVSALDLVKALDEVDVTLDKSFFPDTGSYMDQSQLAAFCSFFGLSNPASSLQGAWELIPTIREARNAIAHGRERSTFYGGRYTRDDMLNLCDEWRKGWGRFMGQLKRDAKKKDFWHLQ